MELGAWRGQSPPDYTVSTEEYVGGGEKLALARAQDSEFKSFFDRGKVRRDLLRGVVRLFSTDLGGIAFSEPGRISPGQGSFRMAVGSGTGLLLFRKGAWHILTAGHVVPGPGSSSQTLLLMPGFDPIRLEALPSPTSSGARRDLALLSLPPTPSLEPSVAARLDELAVDPLVRGPRRGEAVMILGFPGGDIGVNAQAAIRTAAGPFVPSTDDALEPIVVLAEVADTNPFELEFHAGIIPLGGMSGSPVYGVDGALLGVFTGIQSEEPGRWVGRGSALGICQPLLDFLPSPESSPESMAGEKASVLTESDYLRAGVDGVERYLNEALGQGGAGLRRALGTAASAIVEIRVKEDIQGGFWSSSFSQRQGSGVLVGAPGHILSAGHVVDDLVGQTEMQVFGSQWHTDRVQVLDVADAGKQDWVHLRVEGAPARDGLPVGSVALGDLVVSVGFPGGYGIDADGRVRLCSESKDALDPIPLIARVSGTQPIELTLVAGAMPWGGASGSPVCNKFGELVGIIAGVNTTILGNGDSVEVISVSPLPSLQTEAD